jgi:hypothetical protein
MPATKQDVKTFLVYCEKCKLGLGWGAHKPSDTRLGHFVGSELHKATLVEMKPGEALTSGETNEAFLARMVKQYVTK